MGHVLLELLPKCDIVARSRLPRPWLDIPPTMLELADEVVG
jgi:hypothetical protein